MCGLKVCVSVADVGVPQVKGGCSSGPQQNGAALVPGIISFSFLCFYLIIWGDCSCTCASGWRTVVVHACQNPTGTVCRQSSLSAPLLLSPCAQTVPSFGSFLSGSLCYFLTFTSGQQTHPSYQQNSCEQKRGWVRDARTSKQRFRHRGQSPSGWSSYLTLPVDTVSPPGGRSRSLQSSDTRALLVLQDMFDFLTKKNVRQYIYKVNYLHVYDHVSQILLIMMKYKMYSCQMCVSGRI